MESVLSTIVPLVSAGCVYAIVAGIKKLQAIKYADDKKPLLRMAAAVLSFAGVVVVSIMTGQDVDPSSITNLVDLLIAAALSYMGATGIHTLKNS